MALYCILIGLSIICNAIANCCRLTNTIEREGEQAQPPPIQQLEGIPQPPQQRLTPQQIQWHIQQQAIQLEEFANRQVQVNDGAIALEFVEGDPANPSSAVVAPSEISNVPVFQSEHNPSDVSSEHIPETASSAKSVHICSICHVDQPAIMYDKCKHVCTCEACDNKYKRNICPICQQVSKNKVRVYFS